jgi:adenine-specific DNA-methyltransferase
MDKMKMHTVDITDSNIEKIGQLFPNCLTERISEDGYVEMAIDFDQLRQELSKSIIEGPQERYQFSWPDKKKAIRLANTPTSMTLRPYRKESVDFDNTQNLYIEGDNLEVLKLLRENYLGKVRLIYVDPPYNTGSDFVYADDFSQDTANYLANSGQTDTEGNRLVLNTESNGRFHTDWLNMIYPRLKVAKDLLSSDGVILISIDDNEVRNLRILCDDIFGAENFIAQMIWQGGKMNAAKFISTSHEYVMAYAKSLAFCSANGVKWREQKKGLDAIYKKVEELQISYKNNYSKASEQLKKWYKDSAPEDSRAHAHYCNIDDKGVYCMDNVSRVGGGKYSVINPINGLEIKAPTRGWVYGKEEDFWKAYEAGIIMFQDNDKLPILKRYLKDNEQQLLDTVFYKDRRGARIRLRDLMGNDIFDFPKDEEVITNFISVFSSPGSTVLDFFSGSGTTAHAVMIQNSIDRGDRKFIMVQIPEETDLKSEAYKAGYMNICEIGKERIRRAGKKILADMSSCSDEGGLFAVAEEEKPKIDVGFRVLKLDSSNMEEVYYRPEDSSEVTLFEDNVKPNRSSEDLLFQVMLECNLPLSATIQTEKIDGKEVFSVNNGYLIACFDEDVNEVVITAVAKRKPYYFIMRDKSLSSDNVADNFEQIFQAYSKETIRRIL